MQLVKRFVKITFLMDELSGKENELHSLHDVICTLRLKLVFLCVVSLFWKEDVDAHRNSTNLDLEILDSMYV